MINDLLPKQCLTSQQGNEGILYDSLLMQFLYTGFGNHRLSREHEMFLSLHI